MSKEAFMKTIVQAGSAFVALVGVLSACTSDDPDAARSMASIQTSCINPTQITKQEILSDQEIRFELNNGEVWVNHLPRTCFSLKRQGGFTWAVTGTLVCSNEQTIYVREDGTPCQLGEFTRLPPTAS
jgi:hypothetical protein